ncbi:MAG: hypothetical protein APF78_10545 [Sphingomonadales bacterium BRH_c3]|nr:MAG: hypothetical protein APF78_10545 [Sphingomonadales bacterium BRH_c3]
MSAASAGKLYTPELLSLATELANYPLSGEFSHSGEARSKTCGSSIRVGLETDDRGGISRLGMAVTACAVGQGSAAIFAANACGRNASELATTLRALENWLDSADAPMPDWPGFAALRTARDYPARHGALLLPWRAAAEALCKADGNG